MYPHVLSDGSSYFLGSLDISMIFSGLIYFRGVANGMNLQQRTSPRLSRRSVVPSSNEVCSSFGG